jgi:ABC-type multidrug transport system ATPase subunit
MLTISNRSKTYSGRVRALDAASLEVPKGMFGLLGPNGAGIDKNADDNAREL